MTDKIKRIYDRLLKKEYRAKRSETIYDFSEEFSSADMPLVLRSSERLSRLAAKEKAILFEGDRIGFVRTVKRVMPIVTPGERDAVGRAHFVFDGGQVCNISSDYETTLRVGLEARQREILAKKKEAAPDSKEDLLIRAMLQTIDAVYTIADKYAKAAKEIGCTELCEALARVPRLGASSYYEALVFFRLLNFMLWLNGNKHNTVGRFDQYMYPYFSRDIAAGELTREEAKELTEELFISLNFDADLYPGIQQGDNGQSMMLGACDRAGKDSYNDLSKLCLECSLELSLIDPKINLRVNKDTPDDVYRLGTLLTKQGLGFPQYSNDDVVIPALVDLGYDIEDARDYTVAACWEFIIPGVAMDIPNIDAVNFPQIILDVAKTTLVGCKSFDTFLAAAEKGIRDTVLSMAAKIKNMYMEPSPFQSILMADCVKNMRDISEGAKYNNFGFHGAGISNAADALAAIKKTVFEDKTVGAQELLDALAANFEGYDKVRKTLLDAPKMGNNDDYVDAYGKKIIDCFADSLDGVKTERGGIIRAGTGTAMYYIWFSENLGATADGRKKGEPFSANYSPSLNVRTDGVLSVIKSFTKPNLRRACNGGPLTLEFHDTLFRNEEGVTKVAALVKTFVKRGGHQIQLNAINRDTLIDAQLHPENHQNLIVRVWGWSGYFLELDPVYQSHIMKRLEFMQ